MKIKSSCRSTCLGLSLLLSASVGFLQPPTQAERAWTILSQRKQRGLFGFKLPDLPVELPNPFKVSSASETSSYEDTSTQIRQAKLLIASDLGLQDPTLLDDTRFKWIGPTFDQPLSKDDYVAAGRFFDLRSAFPDLDYRAHDFRVDDYDENTVRLTCRVTGTMRGELRLRGDVLTPTGKTMRCPPEAVSITFDKRSGKVVKLLTGFCMDRQTGNTGGTTGVMAAATIGGQPPSDFEMYPLPNVVSRFFGRPVPQISEAKGVLAPFPETVMIQLAKGILAGNMATEDPSLLGRDFTYSTPYVGPIKKEEYLKTYALAEFKGIDPSLANFRVDLYDPYRVWLDIRPTAPGYNGSPQAMSFTFDDDGFCIRITSAYVIDPTVGNGGGLGGQDGYLYAIGQSRPDILTRPVPRLFGRARKFVTSPLTKVGPDDYELPGKQAIARPLPPRPPVPGSPKESFSSLRSQSTPRAKPAMAQPSEAAKMEQARKAQAQEERRRQQMKRKKQELETAAAQAEARKQQQQAAQQQRADQLQQSQATRTKQRQADAQKAEAESKRQREALEKKRQQQAEQQQRAAQLQQSQAAKAIQRQADAQKAEAERKRKQEAAAKKRQQEAQRAESERTKKDRAEQQKQLQAKRERDAEARRQNAAASKQQQAAENDALKALADAASGATIALFGSLGGGGPNGSPSLPVRKPSTKKAPAGVPTINRWRKNINGSITGLISGSRQFVDDERITTSPIASGTVASGEVVKTGSGSRYFLR